MDELKEVLNKKQVDKEHYEFSSYMNKPRWVSIWHQVDEILKSKAKSVLEIGPGIGLLKNIMASYKVEVKTLDIDPDLDPDYLINADEMVFFDNSFDAVCAFQVLEHMEFCESVKVLKEMARVSKKTVIISLPDATTSWASTVNIPKLGVKKFIMKRPFYKAPQHIFDGEHYWEIGKKGFLLESIIKDFITSTGLTLIKTYRVHENQYHRFFVFEKVV